MSEICDAFGIPKHLHKNGRDVDPNFLKEECLYRRFSNKMPPANWYKDEGNKKNISASLFPLNSDSYNRSKYCKAEDVLYNDSSENHYLLAGIFTIRVSKIEQVKDINTENEPKRKFTLMVEHTPKECNYSHSEVFCYENGNKLPYGGQPTKSIRMVIRDYLLSAIDAIHKYPTITEDTIK